MTDSASQVLKCPGCGRAWFPEAPHQAADLSRCPGCGSAVRVVLFPAWGRALPPVEYHPVVLANEAACFFHATRRAVVACAQCGCFLCALCDLEVGGRHLCPGCLEDAQRRSLPGALERRRVRHDRIVWALLLAPLAACGFLLPVSALVALFWIWRHWRSAPSRLERSRLRMACGIPVAVVEFGGGVWFWIMLLTS